MSCINETETYDFCDHIQGTTLEGLQLQITDDGTPIDITGADIKCQFRQSRKTGDLVRDFSVGSGITITDAPNGMFEIDAFLLDGMDVATYFYDIKTVILGYGTDVFLQGKIKILQGVTQ